MRALVVEARGEVAHVTVSCSGYLDDIAGSGVESDGRVFPVRDVGAERVQFLGGLVTGAEDFRIGLYSAGAVVWIKGPELQVRRAEFRSVGRLIANYVDVRGGQRGLSGPDRIVFLNHANVQGFDEMLDGNSIARIDTIRRQKRRIVNELLLNESDQSFRRDCAHCGITGTTVR